MEFLIIIFYLLFIIYELRRNWKILCGSKSDIYQGIALGVTVAFLIYIVSELFSFVQNKNGKSFTVGWYAFEFPMMLSFAVYTFICWCLAMFSKERASEESLVEPVIYGFHHVFMLFAGSVVACYLTIEIHLFLFPPLDNISLHGIFWSAVYFIFFVVVTIRMNLGMKITKGLLLRILFLCTITPQILIRIFLIF